MKKNVNLVKYKFPKISLYHKIIFNLDFWTSQLSLWYIKKFLKPKPRFTWKNLRSKIIWPLQFINTKIKPWDTKAIVKKYGIHNIAIRWYYIGKK